jgi:phosphoglycolate phosphatase-like HAD superfamily hydrolase
LNISPNHSVMIGDMEMDLEAGRRAGTLTIAILSGFLKRDNLQKLVHQPDFVFQDIAELGSNLAKIESAVQNRN